MGSPTWDGESQGKMRAGFLLLAALLIALSGARAALAQAPCSKADFVWDKQDLLVPASSTPPGA